jgi:hypothetical protein
MTSLRPASVISKLNHDLLRGSLLGMLMLVGLSALPAASCFGV